jgi:hypothetical protein
VAAYCQNSSCGTVNYRPYGGGKIRWRYGTEPWQEIIGADNYEINPLYGSPKQYVWSYDMGRAILSYSYITPGSNYRCNNSPSSLRQCEGIFLNPRGSSDLSRKVSSVFAPIYKYRVSNQAIADLACYPGGQTPADFYCGIPTGYRQVDILCHGIGTYSSTPVWVNTWLGTKSFGASAPGYMLQVPHGGEYSVVYNPLANTYVGVIPGSYDWKYFNFITTANVAPTSYLLNIFDKNGALIRAETRATYPEVQVIPCSLSTETKAIVIKKLANLERIEINNTGIPSECLNVYTSGITTDFQAQICSSPGCPPPQYEVICCAPCQSCPAGTCAVQCGNQICCYGADGISKQSIALANYCPS